MSSIINNLLEPFKAIESDKEIQDLINISYKLYSKEIKITDQKNVHLLSNLVRFFRSLNITRKVDEELLSKDIFKNKPNSLNLINEKITQIYKLQSQRVYFTEKYNKLMTKGYNNSVKPILLRDLPSFTKCCPNIISSSSCDYFISRASDVKCLFDNVIRKYKDLKWKIKIIV